MPRASAKVVATYLKQHWHCEKCDRFGYLFFFADEDAESKMISIAEQHAIMEENCHLQNLVNGIRILGSPELAA